MKEKQPCSDFRNDYIISCFVGVFEIDDIHLFVQDIEIHLALGGDAKRNSVLFRQAGHLIGPGN